MIYLIRSGFWLNSNIAVTSLLSFLLSIAFANLLSKETFGVYQFILSAGSLLTALTQTGMNTAIIKAVARGNDGALRASIKPQLRWNTIASAVSLIVAVYYASRGNTSYALMFSIVAIAIPIFQTYNGYSAFFSGKKDFYHIFVFNTALSFMYFFPMLAVVYVTKNPICMVLTYYATNTLGTYFLYRKTFEIYPTAKMSTKQLDLPYAKKLSFSNILPSFLVSADSVIVYYLLGPAMLAIYVIVFQIPERVLSLTRTITSAAFPKLSTHTPESIRSVILSKVVRLFFLALIVAFVYAIFSGLIFSLFFPAYKSALHLTYIASGASIFSVIASFTITTLIATSEDSRVYTVNTIYPIISIISIVIGTVFGGLSGAIIGKGIGSCLTIALSLSAIFSKRRLQRGRK